FSVPRLSFADGRVAQVCDECLAQRDAQRRAATALRPGAVVVAPILGALGALGAAVLWGAAWAGCIRLIEAGANPVSGGVQVPHLLLFAVLALIVSAGTAPVCFALRRVRHRGRLFAGLLGGAFGVAGLLLGQVLLSTWLVYAAFGVVSIGAGMRLLPHLPE